MPTTYHIEKIVVDKPRPDAEPFFGITLQKVVCDEGGVIVQVKSRHDVLYLKESDLAEDEVDIHDDVTDMDIHISGDGVYHSLLKVCNDMVSLSLNYKLNDDGVLVDE